MSTSPDQDRPHETPQRAGASGIRTEHDLRVRLRQELERNTRYERALREATAFAYGRRDLNDLLIELGRPGVFVTLAAVHFDEAGGAECGLAGHTPLLHYRRGSRSVERIEASGPPLA